jgi:hypothetical protein
MINENGKAAPINVFCNACNPPLYKRTKATIDREIPQVIFTVLGGVSDPYVVCIPSTNVAESADVIKNVQTSVMATVDRIVDQDDSLKMANKTSSVAS